MITFCIERRSDPKPTADELLMGKHGLASTASTFTWQLSFSKWSFVSVQTMEIWSSSAAEGDHSKSVKCDQTFSLVAPECLTLSRSVSMCLSWMIFLPPTLHQDPVLLWLWLGQAPHIPLQSVWGKIKQVQIKHVFILLYSSSKVPEWKHRWNSK